MRYGKITDKNNTILGRGPKLVKLGSKMTISHEIFKINMVGSIMTFEQLQNFLILEPKHVQNC